MGKEGCRALDEVNAPLVAGCREAGHVADNAAAERYQGYIASGIVPEEGRYDALDAVKVLVLLTVLQDD